MANSRFGYVAAQFINYLGTTPAPADTDYKTLDFDPSSMPQFLPFGTQVRAPDGSLVYMGTGTWRILFGTVRLKGKPDGSAPTATVGTVADLMAEYRTAINQADGLIWFNCFNPQSGAWEQFVARLERPNVAAPLGGGDTLQNFEIVLRGKGVLAGSYTGGVVNAPAASTAPTVPGDGGLGSGGFGVGHFGYGPFGHGE